MRSGLAWIAAIAVIAVVAWAMLDGRSVVESASRPPEAQAAGASPARLEIAASRASGPSSASGLSAPSAPRAEEPARASEIRGRVVDRGGIPITHAEVRVVLRIPNDQPAYVTTASFEQAVPVAADGRFRVAVPKYGKYLVFVDPPGFGMAAREWVNPGDDVELVVDAPASIEGRVARREDGATVAGARVVLFPSFWDRFVREAKSDEAGRFRFTGLPAGKVWVSTWIEGLVGHWDEVTLAAGETKVQEVSLERGIVVSGKVVELESGRPIEGARFGGPERSVLTDVRGEFSMPGLTPGSYTFEAWTPGRVKGSIVAVVDERRAPQDLVFALEKAELVSGLVLDADGDQPIEGVVVDSQFAVAKTDAAGRFEVSAQPGDNLLLSFRHPKYSAATRGWRQHVEAVGSATMRLERSDVRISGRVTVRGGPGIADARVRCVATTYSGEGCDRVTGTDRDGRYEITGCPRHCGWDVIAVAPGFAQSVSKLEHMAPVPPQIDFVLDRCAVVEGVVVDESGNPVKGAEITLSRSNFGGYGVGGEASSLTPADGRFRVSTPFVAAGAPVVFGVRAIGFVTEQGGYRAAPEGETRIVLRRTGRIRGRLVDAATDAPVKNAKLAILDADLDAKESGNGNAYHWGQTAESAEFEFEAPPGAHWLVPEAKGYVGEQSVRVEVRSGAVADVGTIRLQPGGSIEGTIRTIDGGFASACVFVRDAKGAARNVANSDGSGWYRADGLASGAYEVFATVRPNSLSPCSALGSVTVVAGKASKLDGLLQTAATLKVLVSGDTERKPLDDSEEEWSPAFYPSCPMGGPDPELTIASPDPTAVVQCGWTQLSSVIVVRQVKRWAGPFVQVDLPPAQYRIVFKAAGYEARDLSATLAAGKETTVTLVLKRVP